MEINSNAANAHREQEPDLSLFNPQTTNNDATSLSDSLHSLSLGTASATPLPASSPAGSPQKTPNPLRNVSSPGTAVPQYSPVRRTPSSSSLNHDRRSSTPILHNKRSVSSLQNIGGVTPPRSNLSRRSSSNLLSSPATNMNPKSPLGVPFEEQVQNTGPTASSVAKEHFKREISLHESSDLHSKTVVVIHDSCYGHRYSRPRTSKASLSTIVERPERIHAGIVGLSTAYIRLGERHAGGHCAPIPDLDLKLLPTPPFQIRKTTRSMPLSSPAVTHVHGNKWMEELQIMCDSAEGTLALNGKELVRPAGHGKEEDGSPSPKLHEGDLYLCAESLNAFRGALGGVCDGIDAIFGSGSTRRAFVCIRPPGHHCSSNYPSGFCWLNNVHVGIAYAAMTHGLTHAAILDFDLHHGDGSQTITWNHNRKAASIPKNAAHYKKTPIGYFSLHDINSYPCEIGDEEKVRNASLCIENAHGQSIWNVHLEPWKNAAQFWQLYESRYSVLLEKARVFLRHHTQRFLEAPNGPRPKAAIFLSAGFDASEWEGAGMQRHKVNVPTDFYARFTMDVVRLAEEEALGVDGRVISVLEGGYSGRALTSGILSHLCGLADARSRMSRNGSDEDSRLAHEMGKRMGLADRDSELKDVKPSIDDGIQHFDSDWWTLHHLEELEALINPPPAVPASKKPHDKIAPTYSSPTQASVAKMVTPTRNRRSLSGIASLDGSAERLSVVPEPPPEVDWATAAYELSKVLIPTNRQTQSCRHEDLNAEATRARRERQSTVGLQAVPAEGKRMQLRDRKAKTPAVEEEITRPPSRGSRRRTIAAVADLPDQTAAQELDSGHDGFRKPTTQPRRRLSVASSVTSSVSGLNGDRMESVERDMPYRSTSNEMNSSARPGPALSTKPLNAPMVKKSRVVSAPRAQPVKARISPKKTKEAPPVPRVPSGYLHSAPNNSVPRTEPRTENVHPPSPQPLSSNEGANNEEVDNLASDVKKLNIKLKVPPPEEQAARKQAAEEKKKPVARAPKKSAAPKVAKSTHARANSKITVPVAAEISTTEPQSHIDLGKHTSPALTQGTSLPSQALPTPPFASPPLSSTSNPPALATTIMESVEKPTDQAVELPPPKPSAPPTTEVVPPVATALAPAPAQPTNQQPSTLPPPPHSPPTSAHARKTKVDLPVFTSNSPIPFAPVARNAATSPFVPAAVPVPAHLVLKSQPNDEGNGVAIPPTSNGFVAGPAAKESPSHQERAMNLDGAARSPTVGSENGNGIKQEPATDEQGDERSIWDVPETPRH